VIPNFIDDCLSTAFNTLIGTSSRAVCAIKAAFALKKSYRHPQQLETTTSTSISTFSNTDGDDDEEEEAVSYRNPDPGQQIQLVFLPWDSSIDESVEFRCFVHNRRLCAISQYDLLISSLLQVPERLSLFKRLIEQFYQQMKTRIPYDSCVMDIILRRHLTDSSTSSISSNPSKKEKDVQWRGEDKEKWRVHLLEFNPYYADGDSGACLFDWEREFSIIYNGFKFQHEERKGDEDKHENWRTVLRYRAPDPKRNNRSALDSLDPFVVDVI